MVSTQGCPTTRPSVTSPYTESGAWRKGLPAAYNSPGGGGQRSDRAARATIPDFGKPAAMRPSGTSAQSPWMLAISKGSRRALCHRGPVLRRSSPNGRVVPPAPRSHTQPSVSQGPQQTALGSATLCWMQSCGAGIRPDQAGPGIRQFLLRGLEKANGEWSRSAPATTCSN